MRKVLTRFSCERCPASVEIVDGETERKMEGWTRSEWFGDAIDLCQACSNGLGSWLQCESELAPDGATAFVTRLADENLDHVYSFEARELLHSHRAAARKLLGRFEPEPVAEDPGLPVDPCALPPGARPAGGGS